MSALSFLVEHFYVIVQVLFVPKYPCSNIYNLFLFVERNYHAPMLLAFLLFACWDVWERFIWKSFWVFGAARRLSRPGMLAASHPPLPSPAGARERMVPGATARMDLLVDTKLFICLLNLFAGFNSWPLFPAAAAVKTSIPAVMKRSCVHDSLLPYLHLDPILFSQAISSPSREVADLSSACPNLGAAPPARPSSALLSASTHLSAQSPLLGPLQAGVPLLVKERPISVWCWDARRSKV